MVLPHTERIALLCRSRHSSLIDLSRLHRKTHIAPQVSGLAQIARPSFPFCAVSPECHALPCTSRGVLVAAAPHLPVVLVAGQRPIHLLACEPGPAPARCSHTSTLGYPGVQSVFSLLSSSFLFSSSHRSYHDPHAQGRQRHFTVESITTQTLPRYSIRRKAGVGNRCYPFNPLHTMTSMSSMATMSAAAIETNAPRIVISSSIMTGVAFLFMSLRFFCKARYQKRIGLDDYMLAGAWVRCSYRLRPRLPKKQRYAN